MTTGPDLAPHPADQPSLLGRQRQLADFAALLDGLAAGRGGLLWIRGDAGIGKTSLLRACEEQASSTARVLHGRGWEDASTPAFWLWTQVLRDAAGGQHDLAAAWGPRATEAIALLEGTGLGSAPSRFPLFDSIGSVLRELARTRPLVVLLDDVHWADEASLKLLHFLAGDLAHAPVLLVCAWRDQEALQGERRTLPSDLAVGLTWQLAGLDADDTATLITAASGLVVAREEALAVQERTHGNPLFVAEMARLAAARGSELVSSVVPDTAQAVIRRRVARLNQSAYELLVAASVLGSPTLADLAALARRERGSIGHDLGLLADAGLVTVREERVWFGHALIRDAVYDAIAPGRRSQLHLAAADLLAPGGLLPDHRAAEATHHLLRASAVADPGRLVEALRRAAGIATINQAWEEAVRLHRHLLALVEPGHPERGRVLSEAGQALIDAGELEAARDLYLEAAGLARAAGDGEGFARAALGFASGLSGFEVRLFDHRQTDLLEEALDRLPRADSELRAAVLARLSVGLSFSASLVHRAKLAQDAVAMADRLGAPMTLGVALSALCDAKADPDSVAFRIRAASRIIEVAHEAADPGLELLGLRLRVRARLEAGQMPSALGDMGRFARISDRLRQPLYAWYVPLWQGLRAELRADATAVQAAADEAASIGALADSENAAILALVQRGWARRIGGSISDGMNLVLEQLAPFFGDSSAVLSVLRLLPDRPPAEREEALATLPEALAQLPFDAEWVANLAHLVVCCVEADTRDARLTPLYDALLPYRHLCSVDGIGAAQMGSVERYLGMLADLLDRPGAEEHFVAAMATDRSIGGLPLARTQVAFARFLDRRGLPGDRARCQELLLWARAFYAEADVESRVAEISTLLGEAGPPAAGPPRQPSSLRRQGQVWALEFRGTTAHVPAVKGVADLAVLLARPDVEVHVLDLVGEGVSVHQHDVGQVLDEQARSAYRRRLEELAVELDDADLAGDQARGERAQAERDALLHELGAATGLGGRRRTTGDSGERARTTVTSRIKDAIKRIDEVHPELARHLRASVRTGTFCSYAPEQPETWEVDPTT